MLGFYALGSEVIGGNSSGAQAAVGRGFPQSYVIVGIGSGVAVSMVGDIAIDLLTHEVAGLSWQAASGNGTLTYEYSFDGGDSYTDNGTARSVVRGGLQEMVTYAVSVRGTDSTGNVSAPLVRLITMLAAPIPVLPDPTPAPTLASRSSSWLQDAMVRWSHRDDLVPMFDDFVMLAEKRINDDLEARLQVAATTITTIAKLDGVLVPSDVAEIRALSVVGHGSLDYLPPESFYQKAAHKLSGPPRFYTVVGPYIHMYPMPDAVYPMACAYQQKIPSLLDEEDGVNWLIRDHPDIYLSAVMCEVMNYTENLAKLPVWEAKYRDAIESLNGTDWHTGTSLCIRSDTTTV